MNFLTLFILTEGQGVYYCQEGDTLDGLAQKFITTKNLIVKDNFLTSDIKRGDCLYIKIYKKVYTVKVGDTPLSVANALNVSVEEMFKTNKINYIYPYMRVVAD